VSNEELYFRSAVKLLSFCYIFIVTFMIHMTNMDVIFQKFKVTQMYFSVIAKGKGTASMERP
jgi:hypothetical protein